MFDYDKLDWFNGEYLRAKTPEEFTALAMPWYQQVFGQEDKPLGCAHCYFAAPGHPPDGYSRNDRLL